MAEPGRGAHGGGDQVDEKRGLFGRWRGAPGRAYGPAHGAVSVRRVLGESDGAGAALSIQEKIKLVEWHINRYDQLRASTANRASIVLSACAILSAGDAVILAQLLGGSANVRAWILVVLSAGIAASVSLIVLTVARSTSALISLRPSMKMFPEDDRPVGLLFHASDTIRYVKSFSQFRSVVELECHAQLLEQAEVELWLAVRHYMYRYNKLRGAVLAFRGAALIFFGVLIATVVVNVVHHI